MAEDATMMVLMSFLTGGTVGVSSFSRHDFIRALSMMLLISLPFGSQCGFGLLETWMGPVIVLSFALGYWLRKGGHGSLLLGLLFIPIGIIVASFFLNGEWKHESCDIFLDKMMTLKSMTEWPFR